MATARMFTIGMALISVLADAKCASAGESDPEIAALKRQLKLMQQKLDRLERTPEARSSVAPATRSATILGAAAFERSGPIMEAAPSKLNPAAKTDNARRVACSSEVNSP
jgi:hypothetical protein